MAHGVTVNANIVGSILTQGNKIFNIYMRVYVNILLMSNELSSATQRRMPKEFAEKWRAEVS